jgi:hypothetical protein
VIGGGAITAESPRSHKTIGHFLLTLRGKFQQYYFILPTFATPTVICGERKPTHCEPALGILNAV